MFKKNSLMVDSSQKNEGFISFFRFFNLQWFSAFTRFPSTEDKVYQTDFSPPKCSVAANAVQYITVEKWVHYSATK